MHWRVCLPEGSWFRLTDLPTVGHSNVDKMGGFYIVVGKHSEPNKWEEYSARIAEQPVVHVEQEKPSIFPVHLKMCSMLIFSGVRLCLLGALEKKETC